MVHATVKRESDNFFTVTFGDASSSEDPSGTTTKKMSSSSASSKSASTDNVGARKAQAIAMAKEAVLYARDAVHAVEITDKFMILPDSENKETLLQSKNLAYKAASKGITAIVMLRALGLVPDGNEKGGMQEYVTKMVQQSKIIRDSNVKDTFSKAREEFSKAVDGFERSITTVNSRTAIPKKANSSDSKKAADAVRMAYAAIKEANEAIIGYVPQTLHDNTPLQERLIKTVNALQDAAETAIEVAAMNNTNTDMMTHANDMMDRANLFWITIRMGSDKLSQTIEDFKRSTDEFSNAAGTTLPNASASNSTSASGATAVSAVSNKEMLTSKLTKANEAFSKATEHIKAVSKSGKNFVSAQASISKARIEWKNALDAATAAGVNVATLPLKIPLPKPKSKKGGRRTHRKQRTHRKHQNRTHRRRTTHL